MYHVYTTAALLEVLLQCPCHDSNTDLHVIIFAEVADRLKLFREKQQNKRKERLEKIASVQKERIKKLEGQEINTIKQQSNPKARKALGLPHVPGKHG